MKRKAALLPFLAMIIGHVSAAAHRMNTTPADVISNITDLRYTNLTESWGGTSNLTNSTPNWGHMIFNTISVYPDYLGQIGWLLLFGMPFIMMWIGHGDMTAAGVIGIFLAVYVYAFIGSQYALLSTGIIGISIAAILWSLLQKRG